MTVEEFESQYATRSGVTVEFLHSMGRYGAPCACGEDICDGWQMKYRTSTPDPEERDGR